MTDYSPPEYPPDPVNYFNTNDSFKNKLLQHDKNNRLTVLAYSLSDISKIYPNARNVQLTESEPVIIIHDERLDDNSEMGYAPWGFIMRKIICQCNGQVKVIDVEKVQEIERLFGIRCPNPIFPTKGREK